MVGTVPGGEPPSFSLLNLVHTHVGELSIVRSVDARMGGGAGEVRLAPLGCDLGATPLEEDAFRWAQQLLLGGTPHGYSCFYSCSFFL